MPLVTFAVNGAGTGVAQTIAVKGAVLAMRAAASSIVSSMYQISQLCESGFTLDLLRTLVADARGRTRTPATAELPGDPEVITLDGVSFRCPGKDAARWPTCR